MFEQHDLTNDDHKIESRLRSIQPVPPRLDRDRLMFLAGQQSVRSTRRTRRLWPVLTVTSWAACAAIVGVLATRPPQVVVETRLVERIIEVPAEPAPTEAQATENPSAVAETSRPDASTRIEQGTDFDFDFLDDLRRPLTALASRPALYERVTEPVAIASVEPSNPTPRPTRSETYSDLRRELLGDNFETNSSRDSPWWF